MFSNRRSRGGGWTELWGRRTPADRLPAPTDTGDPVRQGPAHARDREFARRVRQPGPTVRLAVALPLVALLSCGSPPPTISNLRYSPTSAFVGSGAVSVNGSVDFVAAGGDLSTVHISTSTGAQQSFSLQGVAGHRSGTLSGGLFRIDASQLLHFTFEVWVVDAGGLASNHLSGTFDVVLDDTATRWTTRFSVLTGLRRVAFAGGQYVAVGDAGTILTSPDSIAWTSRASGTSNALRGLAWSRTQFIAVGDLGTIVASTDGVSWSPRSSGMPTATLNAVAWSGSQFVAVGSELVDPPGGGWYAVILTSPDGITWTQRAPGLPGIIYGIAWTGSRFVAVGTIPAVLLSTDGITWISVDTGLTFGHLNDVTSNGTRTVAVGYQVGAITSTDDVHWQRIANFNGQYAIAWNGTRFLACGGVYCETSTDGMNWATTQMQPAGMVASGVAWGDARWIVVTSNGAILTSP